MIICRVYGKGGSRTIPEDVADELMDLGILVNHNVTKVTVKGESAIRYEYRRATNTEYLAHPIGE